MLSIPDGETRVVDGVTTFCITSVTSVLGEDEEEEDSEEGGGRRTWW